MELSRAEHTSHRTSSRGAAHPDPPHISPRDRGQPKAVLQPRESSAPGRSPAQHTALLGQLTLLTLAGVWGLSMRLLMGVRGVLPYRISASISRLFFRCCGRCLHSHT